MVLSVSSLLQSGRSRNMKFLLKIEWHEMIRGRKSVKNSSKYLSKYIFGCNGLSSLLYLAVSLSLHRQGARRPVLRVNARPKPTCKYTI